MGWWARAAAAALVCVAAASGPALAAQQGARADFRAQSASADVRFMADWVMQTADHRGLPFAVVDKRDARLYVFDAEGRLSGSSAILLGQTTGDASAHEVGEHTQAGQVPLEERTTPAGRFISEPGRNLAGEDVVWVDYAAAFAIHRLRPGASRRAREAMLESPSPLDNRVSLGCVVVPVAFYEGVVQPALGRKRAIVYVLPETRSVRDMPEAL